MLDRYVRLLKEGEIVSFPTETVYGLGADAWNRSAIKKVFEKKGRPADNPLIVHICDYESVEAFAESVPEDARKLMNHFWPGPLTLIFSKKPEVLDILTGGLDTVALRWPKHPLSQQLIARTGPLVAPSANTSGRPSPTKAEHVKEDFGEDFPVIEAGETDIGLESTVLDLTVEPYTIYRPGKISPSEISEVIGKQVTTEDKEESTSGTPAKSPGTKYTHYAPEAEVRWLDGRPDSANILYLLHKMDWDTEPDNIIHYHGDYRRMAHELFDRFRQADHRGFEAVEIEPFPEERGDGLLPALLNRINKAIGA